MRRTAILGLVTGCLSGLLFSQPSLYQDGVFTIPRGAVIDANNPAYYTDIQMTNDGNGAFRLLAAKPANLVTVNTVEVLLLESFPLQVRLGVTGYKSVPCVELLAPAVSRKDNLFMVILAESVLGPAESCIAMIDPFETSITLDVLGLAAGTYTINVNGVTAEFTFDVDNAL